MQVSASLSNFIFSSSLIQTPLKIDNSNTQIGSQDPTIIFETI